MSLRKYSSFRCGASSPFWYFFHLRTYMRRRSYPRASKKERHKAWFHDEVSHSSRRRSILGRKTKVNIYVSSISLQSSFNLRFFVTLSSYTFYAVEQTTAVNKLLVERGPESRCFIESGRYPDSELVSAARVLVTNW